MNRGGAWVIGLVTAIALGGAFGCTGDVGPTRTPNGDTGVADEVPDRSEAGAGEERPSGESSAATAPDTPSPAERIVHWQVNIEWTVEDMGEDAFARRATEKAHLPDLIAAQELWPTPLCGTGNARGQAARTSLQSCVTSAYGPRSFMRILEDQTKRAYDVRHVADHANAVIWDKARFSYVAGTNWSFGETQALRNACCGSAASPGGCVASDQIGVAVLLRDNRGTASEIDDTHVAVGSVHTGGFGGACIRAHLAHAERAFDGWASQHSEIALARRFVSGDLNTRADTQSVGAAAKRREESPDCWWRSFVKGHACGGEAGSYIDTVWASRWDGSKANDASICTQWTWPMNSDTVRLCSQASDSAGQVYQRIDYTFVKGTERPDGQIRSHVDHGYFDRNKNSKLDPGETYSDSHRGVYTEVDYAK